MTDPDPLDELAGRHREREARAQRATASSAEQAPSKRTRKRNKVLELSLESRSIFVMIATVALSVGGGAFVALLASKFSDDETIIGVAGAAGWFGFFFLVDFAIVTLEKNRELRWLEQLPFAVDREGYLAALSQTYLQNARVELRVEFTAPMSEDVRKLLGDAIAEACFGRPGGMFTKPSKSAVVFQGDTLSIKSPSIETSFLHQPKDGDSKTVFHNRFLHRWLRRCVDKGLRVVHRRYPIAAIDIAVG